MENEFYLPLITKMVKDNQKNDIIYFSILFGIGMIGLAAYQYQRINIEERNLAHTKANNYIINAQRDYALRKNFLLQEEKDEMKTQIQDLITENNSLLEKLVNYNSNK
jgi:hypothetical protein